MPQQYADDAYLLKLYPQLKFLQRAQWLVTVLNAVSGTEYSIAANSDLYAVTAQVGETVPSLQGKLKTEVNGGLLLTAATQLSDQLVLKEVVAGGVTAIAVLPPDGLTIIKTVPSDKYAEVRAEWLEVAQQYVDLCVWGAKAKAGHAVLAAHFIARAIAADLGSGLSIADATALRLGPASIEFGGKKAGGGGSDPFGSTGFGMDYLAMRSTLVVTPISDLGCYPCT